jgi:predicted GIY-YIG superfamily endonuclease
VGAERIITIYHLERNGVPFYVGQTSNTKIRLKAHRSTYGEDVNLVTVDTISANKNYLQLEKDYIELYKNKGLELMNYTHNSEPMTAFKFKHLMDSIQKELGSGWNINFKPTYNETFIQSGADYYNTFKNSGEAYYDLFMFTYKHLREGLINQGILQCK